MSDKYVWKPTQAVIEHSNIGRFMRRHGIAGYRDLVARSTADIEWFWNAVVEDLGIEFFRPVRHAPGHEPGDSLVAMVRRRADQSGPPLPRSSCAIRAPRPDGRHLGGRGRDGPPAHLRRAARRDLPARRARFGGSGSAGATRSGCSCRWSRRPSSRSWPAPRSARSPCRSSPASVRRRSPPGSTTPGEGPDHGRRHVSAAARRSRWSRSPRRRPRPARASAT